METLFFIGSLNVLDIQLQNSYLSLFLKYYPFFTQPFNFGIIVRQTYEEVCTTF